MKFPLGRIVMTQGVRSALDLNTIFDLVRRHEQGDWGDLDLEDWQANDDALSDQDRILSMYRVLGQKIYIITEADRSMTTLLLAEEY